MPRSCPSSIPGVPVRGLGRTRRRRSGWRRARIERRLFLDQAAKAFADFLDLLAQCRKLFRLRHDIDVDDLRLAEQIRVR